LFLKFLINEVKKSAETFWRPLIHTVKAWLYFIHIVAHNIQQYNRFYTFLWYVMLLYCKYFKEQFLWYKEPTDIFIKWEKWYF